MHAIGKTVSYSIVLFNYRQDIVLLSVLFWYKIFVRPSQSLTSCACLFSFRKEETKEDLVSTVDFRRFAFYQRTVSWERSIVPGENRPG